MSVLVITASSTTDGLTAACAAATVQGIRSAGGNAEEVCLNDLQIGMCQACDDGWGLCLPDHECQIEDDPSRRVVRRLRRRCGPVAHGLAYRSRA